MKHEAHPDEAGFSDDLLKRLDRSRSDLNVPQSYFEKKAIFMESAMSNTFVTPADYFKEQEAQSERALRKPHTARRNHILRLWLPLAAAAVFAGIVLYLLPRKVESTSFAIQLEQAQLEFEDLHEMEFEESVYEEFIADDTLRTDTLSKKNTSVSTQDFKPSKGQSVVTWDDIDADDIEEYLKEEESLNIIDEL
jgi:hypothetical protein